MAGITWLRRLLGCPDQGREEGVGQEALAPLHPALICCCRLDKASTAGHSPYTQTSQHKGAATTNRVSNSNICQMIT